MTRSLLTSVLCSISFMLSAQIADLPPSAEPGKCYVKCVTPDIYETTQEKVMVRPAYTKLEVVPAEYKTVEEKILIKPEAKRYEFEEAEFEVYYEDFRTEEIYHNLEVREATFTNAAEKIEIKPEIGRWEYRSYANCDADDPSDCKVLCWVEYDPTYETVAVKRLDKDAYTVKNEAGGKVIKIKKYRKTKPASYNEIKIPAEYRTIQKRVLVKDETTKATNVPAEYKTVTVEKLKQKGGVKQWEEVACELVDYNILPIYYNLGSAALTSAAKKVIDEKIYSLMKQEPLIRVEISSHTDARGSKTSNKDLSQRRARAVVNYLISRGINSSRLVAKGYGEERLVNRCADGVSCTEKEHAQNRRTEFRVISY